MLSLPPEVKHRAGCTIPLVRQKHWGSSKSGGTTPRGEPGMESDQKNPLPACVWKVEWICIYIYIHTFFEVDFVVVLSLFSEEKSNSDRASRSPSNLRSGSAESWLESDSWSRSIQQGLTDQPMLRDQAARPIIPTPSKKNHCNCYSTRFKTNVPHQRSNVLHEKPML